MPILQAVLLGIVQGITEFFPISSSAHLIIFPKLFGWEEQELVFDTTLHLATSLALIVYFWNDIVLIIRSLIKDVSKYKGKLVHYSGNAELGLKIIVGSIPVGIVGFILGDFIEEKFRGLVTVAIFLVLGSLLMFVAEKKYKKRLIVKDSISIKKSFKVGLFQSLSLFPGISRSGSTISGGMIFGLSRKESARFSFLLSIPAVLFAGISQAVSSFDYFNMANIVPLLAGFLSSFLAGYFAIKFMLSFTANNKLYPFIYYRLGLALFLIILSFF